MQAAIEGFRVSFQQQHVWRLQEGGAELRVEAALLLAGEVRLDALRGALADLLERNEVLRTTYQSLPGVEVPLQVIAEECALDLRETEVEALEEAGSEDALDLLIARELAVERGRPFDPRQGPLARFVLLHLPEGDKILLLTFSPLCADALTVGNAVAQIARGYARRVGAAVDSEPSAEPVQYADFSEWQSSLEEELERGRAYWEGSGLSRLDGLVDPLREYQHGVRGREPFRPAALAWSLEPAAAREAAVLAEGLGTPVSTVVLAAWFALLRRLGGGADLVAGVLVDGRPIPPLREALGLFARYVPVSCSLEESFGLLDAVRVASLALQGSATHQQAFAPEVDPAVPFPVLFDARELPEDRAAGEVRFSLLREEVTLDRAKARLSVVERGGAIRLVLHYDPAFYTPEDAELLRERFETLLRQALAEPARPLGELPVLSERERRQVLVEWNATARDTPWTGPFHRLFERQAERTPEGVALVAGNVELTYRELERRANRLARHLRRSGVGLDDRVALCFDRSPELIVGALATLKAGAAFVPLDPLQPQERLRFMLEDVEAAAVLTRQPMLALPASGPPVLALDSLTAELARESGEPLGSGDGGSDPEALAYAIFTSGSTGRPKAVLIRQRSVVNLLAALDEAVYQGIEGPLRVSLNAPLSFDAAIKQLIQLARGRTLCFVPEEIRADGTALLSFLRSRRIDVLDCTPTQLRLLLDAGLSGPGLPRLLLVGGEAIDPVLWQTLAADPHRRYVNVYGPTECTVDATACRVVPGPATIGVPLANVRAYVLDSSQRPVPAAAPGELCIGGRGVARGYARRPDLTAERFVPDPFSSQPGERLYRTGDRVRHLPGGAVEFLGRVDHQVKLRGYRIELGEIEAVLREHPGVDSAVVVAREDQPGNRRLVAYVAPHQRASRAGGRRRYRLPNGMAVAEQNRNETDYLYREIFVDRCYARHGIRLPEEPVVVDVGANIGMFSLFVASHRPRARIFAFEPLAPLFETLQVNTGAYAPGAQLFPFGLAEQERREVFTFYPRYTMMSGRTASSDAAGEVQVIKRFLDNARAQGSEAAELAEHADELLAGRFEEERHEVHLRRLSDVLREQGIEWIDLLKVDVQRAELEVLRGIDPADWAKIRQVTMEVHDAPGTSGEGRLRQLTSWLESLGFMVVAGQDELLAGTDRHNLWAVRPEAEGEEIGEAAETGGGGTASSRQPAAEISAEALRELARSRLPEVMVPSSFVVLDELPLTRNGKVDRAALPVPEEVEGAAEVVAPRTPHEDVMAAIWAEVLGTDRVGADSNFFDLGGHSLLATQLMSRVREVFAVELPLRALFDSPTVGGLAGRVEEARQAAAGVLAPAIVPVSRTGELPLSFSQQRLWFLDQLEPGGTSYLNAKALWLDGSLDVAVLRRTLAAIVARHELLRTEFPAVEGRPVQRILPAVELALPVVDLSGLPEPARDAEVLRLAAREALQPFDLAVAPLLRAALLRWSEERHAILFSMHHIVCDAWSLGVLVREVGTLYQAFLEGRPSPLPELRVQYADFSHWQREWLRGEALEAHLAYWRRRLAGSPPRLELPVDRERVAAPTYVGSRRTLYLSEPLTAALNELSRAQGATLFITLLAGFKALLARLTGQEDVVVGTAIAGRNRIEVEGLIGFFINMLPLRTDLSGNPAFTDLVARVREVALGAYTHQDLPFEKLVEELQPERDAGPAPLFRVAFGLQNAPMEDLKLPGLRLSPVEVASEAVRFDLTVWVWEEGARLGLSWAYSTDLFEPGTVDRLHESFAALLESAVAAPQARLKELEVVTAAAREEQERRRQEREASNLARLKRVERRSAGGA